MILAWKDSKSFNRHLENMRRFRGGHRGTKNYGWDTIKDMPELRDIHVSAEAGGRRSSLEAVSPAVVALWKFTLPEGVIN
jgi:hypothetical protein